jgi:glycosyltransferase involved in cell wall biosynthesis
MTAPLISVIVPVYNVEEYIDACMISVIHQTYTNLEIILIDDGSTDNSGHICDEYAKSDTRIVVQHQQNAGLGMARNTGLDFCHGEYLFFVDSDDYIDDDLIQILFENMCRYDADIISCYYTKCYIMDHVGTSDGEYHQQVIYENREKLLVDLLLDYVPHAVWGKLYKRNVFGSSRFTKLRMSEDVLIWMDLYSNISKVVFLPLQKYHYVIRPNSLMSYNNFNKNLFDDLLIMEQLRNGLPQISTKLGQVGENRYFNTIVHILQDIYRCHVDIQYESQVKAYQREVRQNLLHLWKNPYIKANMKMRLLLVSIDARLLYKVYAVYKRSKFML